MTSDEARAAEMSSSPVRQVVGETKGHPGGQESSDLCPDGVTTRVEDVVMGCSAGRSDLRFRSSCSANSQGTFSDLLMFGVTVLSIRIFFLK